MMVMGGGNWVTEGSQGVMVGEESAPTTSLALSTWHTMLLYITGRGGTSIPLSGLFSHKESITESEPPGGGA